MGSSASCSVCLAPLPDAAASGLCETCAALHTPGDGPSDATESFCRNRESTDAYIPERAEFPAAPDGYALLRQLGIGGMGVVFLAIEEVTGRNVAVKYLSSNILASAKERFRREATALAGLTHPNVVPVYAVNFRPRDAYFTMEYAPGGTLARKIGTGGPLEPAAAAGLIEAVARGLAAAHAVGIVHRDVKPSNILLAADGTPKLADFGLARSTDSGSTLTGDMAVVGTPQYMSPEQAHGYSDAGPPADVYSLGATLFEALTGRPPFVGEGLSLLERVKYEDPPTARGLNKAVPPELSAVVEKCLHKKPAARYSTAAELADDLARWRLGEPVTAKPTSAVTRARRAVVKRWRWAAAAGVVLAAVGAGMAVRPNGPEKQSYTANGKPLSLHDEDTTRSLLLKGERINLLGDNAVPLQPIWVMNPAPFGEGTIRDGSCFFQAQNRSILKLASLPDCDYRISASLRHETSDWTSPDAPYLSIFFGYREILAGEVRHASYQKLEWCDIPGQNKSAMNNTGSAKLVSVFSSSSRNHEGSHNEEQMATSTKPIPPARANNNHALIDCRHGSTYARIANSTTPTPAEIRLENPRDRSLSHARILNSGFVKVLPFASHYSGLAYTRAGSIGLAIQRSGVSISSFKISRLD